MTGNKTIHTILLYHNSDAWLLTLTPFSPGAPVSPPSPYEQTNKIIIQKKHI